MKKNNCSSLFTLLKNPINCIVMLGVAFVLFDIQYYIMANLPGYKDLTCIIGAGLTPENIVFAIIVSLMAALFLIGFFQLFKIKRNTSLQLFSISGIGAFLGALTIFCLPCTISVLSVFGIAIGLSFFTTYNLVIKIISLALLFVGLYLLNKQLKGVCKSC